MTDLPERIWIGSGPDGQGGHWMYKSMIEDTEQLRVAAMLALLEACESFCDEMDEITDPETLFESMVYLRQNVMPKAIARAKDLIDDE